MELEPTKAEVFVATRPEQPLDETPAQPIPQPAIEAPKPERKRYGSFYEAWPNVPELRKYTQRHGVPRLGATGEDLDKANALIDEYRNG